MNDICPKCGALLTEIQETKSGKQLQKCSKGSWNSQTRQNEGCDFVKWIQQEPKEMAEKCPKCGAALMLVVTRFGKKMKKCSKGGWDSTTKKATGCDFVEWINGTSEPLEEKCPECGESLVLYTTAAGKKMKKCSTAGWDKTTRTATGCKYVQWLKTDYSSQSQDSGGEEFLPEEPK
jgi:ssDNA-binding Zn-finger/Zn-ribbon topoisomerase 1